MRHVRVLFLILLVCGLGVHARADQDPVPASGNKPPCVEDGQSITHADDCVLVMCAPPATQHGTRPKPFGPEATDGPPPPPPPPPSSSCALRTRPGKELPKALPDEECRKFGIKPPCTTQPITREELFGPDEDGQTPCCGRSDCACPPRKELLEPLDDDPDMDADAVPPRLRKNVMLPGLDEPRASHPPSRFGDHGEICDLECPVYDLTATLPWEQPPTSFQVRDPGSELPGSPGDVTVEVEDAIITAGTSSHGAVFVVQALDHAVVRYPVRWRNPSFRRLTYSELPPELQHCAVAFDVSYEIDDVHVTVTLPLCGQIVTERDEAFAVDGDWFLVDGPLVWKPKLASDTPAKKRK